MTNPLSDFKVYKNQMIEQLEITLSRGDTIFLPGNRVEGLVTLTLSAQTTISHFSVKFSGRVECTALEKSSIALFKDSISFLDVGVRETQIFEAGSYSFNFLFRMPASNLPASFIGYQGSVKYLIESFAFQHSNLRLKSHACVILTVPSTLDVGSNLRPQSIELDGGVGLFKSGRFIVKASIPTTCYTPEEVIPITLKLINISSFGLVIQSVAIRQRVSYKMADRNVKPRTERIHAILYKESFPSSVKSVERVINFPIPSIPILDPDISTSILNVTHSVVIKVRSLSSLSRPVKVDLPFILAGFPFLLFGDAHLRRSIDTLPVYEGVGSGVI